MTSFIQKISCFVFTFTALSIFQTNAQCSKFYGTTFEGGTGIKGVIFKTDGNGENITLISNLSSFGGDSPSSELCLADNGYIYGTTSLGGTNNIGLIFKLDTSSNIVTKIFDFNSINGSFPASLIKLNNGKLYGVTQSGGINDMGTIFEFDPATNTYTKKHDFDGTNGKTPQSSLIQAKNGSIYGVTTFGGLYDNGVIFEYNPGLGFIKKIDINNPSGGSKHNGSLMQAMNGKIYGVTKEGGNNDEGILFEWNPVTNHFTKIFDFIKDEGANPIGSLIQAGNGKLYGVTVFGGFYNNGVLFEWDIDTKTYTRKVDFIGVENGESPYGPLMQAANGRIYGMTYRGGVNNDGVLFEWDPVTNACLKKIDFNNYVSGAHPVLGLTEVNKNISYGTIYTEACDSFLSPSGNYTLKTTGIYKDFLPNSAGCDSIIVVNLKIKNTSVTIDSSVCKNMTSPSGRYIWSVTGQYKDTIPNSAGCDSVIIMNLIIKNSSSIIDSSVCDNLTSPSGRYIWYSNGQYMDTIQNRWGCDSVVIINLTIKTVDVTVIKNNEGLMANSANSNFQWIDCDSNIPVIGENNPFLTGRNGNYAVVVTKDGCIDTSACFDGWTFSELIRNSFKENIVIYPNPNNGLFFIDLGNEYKNTVITITRLDGSILEKKTFDHERKINFNLNSPGIYLINISAEEREATFKVIVNQTPFKK